MHSITKFIVVALFGLMTSAIPTTPPTSPGGANPAVEPATKHVGASLPDGYGESYGAMRRLIKAADAHGNFKCATYAFIFARGTFDNPMETTAHVAETHKRGDEETAAEKPGEQKEIAAEKPEEEEETGPKNVGPWVGAPLFQAMKVKLKKWNEDARKKDPKHEDITIDFQGVDEGADGEEYLANLPGYLDNGGSPIGATVMAYTIGEYARICPKTKFIISGWSQGAIVAHKAAGNLHTSAVSTWKHASDHVLSAITFGDPTGLWADPHDSKGPGSLAWPSTIPLENIKEFCDEGDLLCSKNSIQELKRKGGHEIYTLYSELIEGLGWTLEHFPTTWNDIKTLSLEALHLIHSTVTELATPDGVQKYMDSSRDKLIQVIEKMTLDPKTKEQAAAEIVLKNEFIKQAPGALAHYFKSVLTNPHDLLDQKKVLMVFRRLMLNPWHFGYGNDGTVDKAVELVFHCIEKDRATTHAAPPVQARRRSTATGWR